MISCPYQCPYEVFESTALAEMCASFSCFPGPRRTGQGRSRNLGRAFIVSKVVFFQQITKCLLSKKKGQMKAEQGRRVSRDLCQRLLKVGKPTAVSMLYVQSVLGARDRVCTERHV